MLSLVAVDLRALKLPPLITNLPAWVFSRCSGFTSLELSPLLINVGRGSFSGCTGLRGEIRFPRAFESINNNAFAGCSGITADDLKFPPFLHSIDPTAFNKFFYSDSNWACSPEIKAKVQCHLARYNNWKKRGNVLMCLSRVDKEYQSEVERKGFFLGSAKSNTFLASFSNNSQLIYKAAAHVDGSGLGNGINRLIFEFLG